MNDIIISYIDGALQPVFEFKQKKSTKRMTVQNKKQRITKSNKKKKTGDFVK